MESIKIILYAPSTGKQPFADWLHKHDKNSQALVLARIARIRLGNFGDCKRIVGGNGLHELRIDTGPGYRIYYGRVGETIVILLVGGDKGSQSRDIEKAKQYWLDAKEQNLD